MPAPNRDLGPCVVVFDPSGTNIQFEKTFNEVFFRYEELRTPIKEDQQGLTDVDEITTGATLELEVNVTREEVAKLEYLFAHATAGAANLLVENPVGTSVFALAKEIIVKPISDGVVSLTTSEWLHIFRAYPRTALDWPYGNTTQRTTKAVFKGFPDDDSVRVGFLWRLGAK